MSIHSRNADWPSPAGRGRMMRMIGEACGIFGIFGHEDAARLTALALCALQHRGQESAGIAVRQGERIHFTGVMGLVSDLIRECSEEWPQGDAAIGHVRYSTTGESDLCNCQPLLRRMPWGKEVAVAHNGNLLNHAPLRESLAAEGASFETTTDTELILLLLARKGEPRIVQNLLATLPMLEGAYSLLFLTPREIVALRDPRGFRPLLLGRLGTSFVVSSESCAFDLIGARCEREIEPGEGVRIDRSGIESFRLDSPCSPTPCAFEWIYLARPDGTVFGENVYRVRKRLGAAVARLHPVEADCVVPVPDTAIPAALGYAEVSGLPVEFALARTPYIGRTFIAPSQRHRALGVRMKLNVITEAVAGKRIVVVDDSIVRGTTARQVVAMLREGGAREIHLRITSPPIRYPCYYGVDILDRRELLAAGRSVRSLERLLGVDSLGYLDSPMLLQRVGRGARDLCLACFWEKPPGSL
ncbi:MAG: amidophosphoribosyltransferase [Deltaproteobacteria bacterium]|nr:MAG: amidophosphoribosyltransferase [Deltaproteobacteria bacterium]